MERRQETSSSSVISFLRPRYHTILRYARQQPLLFRGVGNMSLIVSFTVSLCVAACLFNWIDNIFEEFNKESLPRKDQRPKLATRLSVSSLKNVLDQRGVLHEHVLEREDLEYLALLSGSVTTEEVNRADEARRQVDAVDPTATPDAILHRTIVSSTWDSRHSISIPDSKSVVFDGEPAFVELVDDNKDSLWLLAVLTDTDRTDHSNVNESTISSEIWGQLTLKLASFGFKFGLIDCHRLPRVCHDRGFIAADLVLALPKGGDRIKDSIQFRPYPRGGFRSQTHTDELASRTVIIRHICTWLSSILSERVPQATDIENITPSRVHTGSKWSSWFYQRPPPLHFIWIPAIRPERHSLIDHKPPPLVLSSLSVPFTGRVRFWTLLPESSTPVATQPTQDDTTTWPVAQHTKQSPDHFLKTLGCPPDSTYVLVTPEATCHDFGARKQEYPDYRSLELFLRFMYPSADDMLCISVVLLNLLVLLNSAIVAAKVSTSYADEDRLFRSHTSPVPNRLRLLRSVYRLARYNWMERTPTNVRDAMTSISAPASTLSRFLSNRMTPRLNRFAFWLKALFCDLLSTNFILLITVLPIINILNLSHASPVVNLFLITLRKFAGLPPVIAFRTHLVGGHVTLTRFFFWLCLFWFSLYFVFTNLFKIFQPDTPSPSHRWDHIPPRTAALLERLQNATDEEMRGDLSRLLQADFPRDRSDSSSQSNTEFPIMRNRSPRYLERLRFDRYLRLGYSRLRSTTRRIAPVHIYSWRFQDRLSANDPSNLALSDTPKDSSTTALSSSDSEDSLSQHPSPIVRRRLGHPQSDSANPSESDSSTSSSDSTITLPDPPRLLFCAPKWVLPCDSCVICWSSFKTRVLLSALSCGHCFHDYCIRRWLGTGAPECPVCRWPAHLPHSRQQNFPEN